MYGSTQRQLITVNDRTGEQTHYVTEQNGETSPLIVAGGGSGGGGGGDGNGGGYGFPDTQGQPPDCIPLDGLTQTLDESVPVLPGQQSNLSFHQVCMCSVWGFLKIQV